MLTEERMEICRKCPLYKESAFRIICNSKLYLSEDGVTVSHSPKPGYKKGCGCKLKIKTANPNAHCIVGKW